MSRSSKKNSIVVSVDFGTTYSGASYTFRGKPEPPEQIPVVKGWTEGNNCEKVPTELRYEIAHTDEPKPKLKRKRDTAEDHADQHANGTISNVVEWGFEVDHEEDYIRFVKLLLDQHQRFPSYVDRDDLEAQLRRAGKTPVDAAADYLSKMKDHIFEVIDRRFGETMRANTKVELVLTVPALWSDAAKDATRMAAEKAKFSTKHNFSMVSEPEAAAICTLKQMDGVVLSVGDIWIVVDAGGGTVDVISYEVVSLGPLRLQESVAGSGDICGSGLLNVRFAEYVKDGMGRRGFEEFCQNNYRAWNQCLQHFEERTKRDFDPFKSPKKDYHLPLFGAKDNILSGIVSHHLILKPADLKKIFDPIISAIIGLVNGQYTSLIQNRKTPKGAILVGGFGESNYLFKTLEEVFAKNNPGFSVLQPANAWSAVARGAVIYALEGEALVQSRISRRHYGVVNRLRFDETKHSAHNKVWDDDDEQYYADNQIKWYVKKGQPLPSGQTITMPFHVSGKEPLVQEIVTLVESDEDVAPKEYALNSPRTRVSCTICADLLGLPVDRWKFRHTESGRLYYVMDYGVGMTFTSALIVFDMRVGKHVYGTATADYE